MAKKSPSNSKTLSRDKLAKTTRKNRCVSDGGSQLRNRGGKCLKSRFTYESLIQIDASFRNSSLYLAILTVASGLMSCFSARAIEAKLISATHTSALLTLSLPLRLSSSTKTFRLP